MFDKRFLNVLNSLVAIILVLYGSGYVVYDILYNVFPFGIIVICILAFAVYMCHIPPPDTNIVQAIVGKPLIAESADNNTSTYFMKTVAHRGAGLDAPENSLAAFKLCSEKGCNAIEFDVMLTADNVPVIFHDDSLERMAGKNVHIAKHNWDELSKIDISVKHPFKDRFTNATIPTLDATVQQLLGCGQRMFIDVKDSNRKITNIILDLFKKYPELSTRAVVTTFYPNVIYVLRRNNPKIACSLGWRPHVFAYESYSALLGTGERRSSSWYMHYFLCACDIIHEWLLPHITYYVLGLSFVLLHKDVISGQLVRNWEQKGIRVMAWTVNHPVEKQFLARILKITYLTDTLTGESSTHLPAN